MAHNDKNIIDWRPKWEGDELEYYKQLQSHSLPRISQFRSFREKLGMSQKEVATILGTTQSNVSKIEARSDPSLSVLSRIVEKRGGTLKLIIELDDEKIEMTA